MEIKLIPSQSKQIAEDILKGVLPPETGDLEVVYWLSEFDPSLTAYRIDEFNQNGGGDRRLDEPVKVVFSTEQIKIALENDIEMRPIAR
jgi:hypothetical protein